MTTMLRTVLTAEADRVFRAAYERGEDDMNTNKMSWEFGGTRWVRVQNPTNEDDSEWIGFGSDKGEVRAFATDSESAMLDDLDRIGWENHVFRSEIRRAKERWSTQLRPDGLGNYLAGEEIIEWLGALLDGKGISEGMETIDPDDAGLFWCPRCDGDVAGQTYFFERKHHCKRCNASTIFRPLPKVDLTDGDHLTAIRTWTSMAIRQHLAGGETSNIFFRRLAEVVGVSFDDEVVRLQLEHPGGDVNSVWWCPKCDERRTAAEMLKDPYNNRCCHECGAEIEICRVDEIEEAEGLVASASRAEKHMLLSTRAWVEATIERWRKGEVASLHVLYKRLADLLGLPFEE